MTFAIATLMGGMALGTDVVVMSFKWMQLQKGADAAALAGAGWLVASDVPSGSTPGPVAAGCASEPDVASQQACTYAYNNKMAVDATNLNIVENSKSLPTAAPTPNIQVWVNRSNLPYMFGKVIGLNTYSVSAIATAAQEETSDYTGHAFPAADICRAPCTGLGSLSGGVSFGAEIVGGDAHGNRRFADVGPGTG